MADALLGVVTEKVLTNVISLANERISGVLGVKEDLQSLAKQLEMIQALLSDAESRSTTNKAIVVWLQELEEAAADADDLLDEFAYQVLSRKMRKGKKNKVRSCFSSSSPLVFRFKMVSKIKKIILQMNEIFKKANQIGLRPAEIINFPTNPREVLLTDPFVDDSKIVGRDDDVTKIVSQLTCSKDEKDLPVIGIVGMGGQGKTTLAQLLMKNDEVKRHFEKRVWTCVSDDFNVDRVLKDMLQSLIGEASQLTNREAIVKRLSTELQGKRFLLVLDDIWNEDSQLWECMNNSLQAIGGSKGSKIIVTTRNETVVTLMSGFVHRLGVLFGKASQELFEKIAFGNGRVAKTPQLVKIGERIVARCGGVPLAIKAIGGLMSSRRDVVEWLKIEESSIWSTLDGVRSSIKLSYDHLPSLSLKQCFAYCSIFPKDSIIEKKNLILQWMAHGLLNPSKGSDLEMEDVGNNYFKILLERSLLQDPEFDMYGNITSCKMHDLVHDFVTEISKGHCLTAKPGELSDDIKAVHLSILPDDEIKIYIPKKKFLRLRTLHLSDYLSFGNFIVGCKCENLRVLTVDHWIVESLPISFAKMKHLRYLDISKTFIRALPEFFLKLYNLHTLSLPCMRILPKHFVRLVNLRHLYIKENYIHYGGARSTLVPGIGQLTSLRTFNCFRVTRDKGCQIEELCNLNHLEGSLKIVGLENVANGDDARRANLSRKRKIESLELVWLRTDNTEGSSDDERLLDGSNDEESILDGFQPHEYLKALGIVNFGGRSLPSWILLLHNLMSLKLEGLKNCEQIPPLGHLPFLKVLYIEDMSSLKCVGIDFYGWLDSNLVNADSCKTSVVIFPSLKELSFINMSSLEEWSDMVQPCSSVELFPSLRKLEIAFCPDLTRLPEGLFSASTGLQSLCIESCEKLVFFPDLTSLHSLEELSIFGCLKFLSLPRGIEACRSLQKLTITCPACVMESLFHYLTNLRELTLYLSSNVIGHIPNTTEDDIQGHDDPFSALEDLTLVGMPQNKSLPEQFARFTALRNLTLKMFDELETLPEWLGNFRSLESLKLCHCSSLANFPSAEVMQGLTNLKLLLISGCPILVQMCYERTSEEWLKIAHIPHIDVM